jgi:hypothetical protein
MRPRNIARRHAAAITLRCAIVLVVTGVMPFLLSHTGTSLAQSTTAKPAAPVTIIAIEVAPVILGEPGTGTRLAVKLSPAAAVPPDGFLRIKGLPASVQLADGQQIASGVWAAPIGDLARLRLKIQSGTQGKSDLTLTLVSIAGQTLAEARSALVVAPAGLLASAAEASAAPALARPAPRTTPPSVPAPGAPADTAHAQARRLHERGLAQLGIGGIVAARALLERAAELGLADAAMALAGTYDAMELSRLGVHSVQPDAAAARHWYARAQALGATGAVERMARLPK